jgi:hypothetical protein
LGLIAGEVVLGLAVLALTMRADNLAAPLRWLRRAHTGNINDYAGFATAGMILVAGALLL